MQAFKQHDMVENSPSVIIFGAGLAGVSARAQLQENFNILGFCDNDPNKHGQYVDGLPVISVHQLQQINPDKILIASEFAEQIHQQLQTLNLSIPTDILPARMLKPVQFGEDKSANQIAVDILHMVVNALEQNNLDYYLDAGTLLGIYRDGHFIPWDDDLDFAVKSDQVDDLVFALDGLLGEMAQKTGQTWEVCTHQCQQGFGAVPAGAVRGLKLKPVNEHADLPMVDFFVKYIDGDWMDYALASRGIRMPSEHFSNLQSMLFEGKPVSLPGNTEAYLTTHYGDWRTPKKDWHLGELTNATIFR